MDENFVGGLKKEWKITDLKALSTQIVEHESTMRLKRRWLMDLPLSAKEQKRVVELLPPTDMIMPESFLREDDLGHEDIRTCIEKAFGVRNSQEEPICDQDDVTILNPCDDFREVSFLLDGMTNSLYPKLYSLLLKDPTNFQGNGTVHFSASESYCAAAFKVLEELENFSCRTLHAMLRKLKGVKGYIPSFEPLRSRLKGNFIKPVRKMCTEMLSEIGTDDEPAEELAGALGVASLTLKLIMNCPGVRDFRIFSPEMVALHYDIAKAIHLLNDTKKVSLIELRKVQLLLDPKFELSTERLRKAVRILLIEYLYESSDMDNIPDFLIETLDIINRRAQLESRKKGSSKVFSTSKKLMKEEIENEMQQLLNISAQAKEVVANFLPEHEFDEEFARAYMEDFDESNAHCVSDDDFEKVDDSQHFKFRSYSSYDQTESIGEIDPVEFDSPVSTSGRTSNLPLSPNRRSGIAQESRHLRSPSYEDSKLRECLGKEYPSGCKTEEFGNAFSDSVKVITGPNKPFLFRSPARESIHSELKSEATTSCTPATAKIGFSVSKAEETDIVDKQSSVVNGYLELQEACDTTSMIAYRFVGYMLDTLAKTEGLELYQGDRLYLHSHPSVPEDIEEFRDTLVSNFSKMWKDVLEH